MGKVFSMNEVDADFVVVGAAHWERVAEEKGRDRVRLAGIPPEEAQRLVSSLPPDGGGWRDVTQEGEWQLGFAPQEDGTERATPPAA